MDIYIWIYIYDMIKNKILCLSVKNTHELRAPCVGSRLRSSSPQSSSLKELEDVTPSSSDGTLIASFSRPEVVNKMPVLQSSRCQDADVAMETMAQKTGTSSISMFHLYQKKITQRVQPTPGLWTYWYFINVYIHVLVNQIYPDGFMNIDGWFSRSMLVYSRVNLISMKPWP